MGRTGDNIGMWDYTADLINSRQRIDHSVSQYGVLGLWAATQLDVPIPAATWKTIDDTWRREQNPDGGWGYGSDNPASTPAMTAAGIATLFITQDMLQGAAPQPAGAAPL